MVLADVATVLFLITVLLVHATVALGSSCFCCRLPCCSFVVANVAASFFLAFGVAATKTNDGGLHDIKKNIKARLCDYGRQEIQTL